MFSNTENSSAKESVKTRPRLKAYFSFIAWCRAHEQKLAYVAGYVLVAALFFGMGRFSVQNHVPDIRVIEPALDLTKLNNNANSPSSQPLAPRSGQVAGQSTTDNTCAGKIKGNISSTGNKIYHLPGGAFYDRTTPEMCFDTETDAQAAGFRKSQR